MLKGLEAVEKYGKEATAGAVVITTRISGVKAEVLQKYLVRGKIINAETHEPLADVNIVVKNTTRGTVSGQDGKFSLPLEKESEEVYFSYVGFKPANQILKNGEIVEIRLHRAPAMIFLPPATPVPWQKIAEESELKRKSTPNPEFTVVESMPYFPGGLQALSNYIASEIKYPGKAKKKGISGKVWMLFTVDKSGNVQNVSVERGIDPDLDREAVRIISRMPKWKPAMQRGKPVPVQINISVDFVL